MPGRMRILAPAKINLTLEVLQRREDGYHALRSLMVPLAHADELWIEPADEPAFTCSDPALAGDDNIVMRALALLPELEPRSVRLIKHIPTQAGLGGGSSDAAAVLLAAMSGAFGRVPEVDWVACARRLGSDVPFFLAQTGALVEGTGERVTAAGELPPWHVLLIKPPLAISTREAYAELDRHPRASRPRNTSVTLKALDALQRADFNALEACLSNDFTTAMIALEDGTTAPGLDAGSGGERNKQRGVGPRIQPGHATTSEIGRAMDALRRAGSTNATLCGSGSAVFALAPTGDTIADIAARVDLPDDYLRVVTRFQTSPAWRGART